MVEFMQQEITIMLEVYCETLKELPRNIQNKEWNPVPTVIPTIIDLLLEYSLQRGFVYEEVA
jgi:hypothetical protein